MSVSLHTRVTPDALPLDTACDVCVRLALRNDDTQQVTVYPGAAKISSVISYAGVGITWGLAFVDSAGVSLPLQELRRWYGPPGNPPGPGFAKEAGVTLARGDEHVIDLLACWIPNALLEPRHLSPTALDPEGMDNIAGPSRSPIPALVERFPLAQASVVVFGAPWSRLGPARTEDDFLRGHVVAFVPEPGTYALHAQYVQSSWMGVGTPLHADAAPVRVSVG